jgi:hypothetical protein
MRLPKGFEYKTTGIIGALFVAGAASLNNVIDML